MIKEVKIILKLILMNYAKGFMTKSNFATLWKDVNKCFGRFSQHNVKKNFYKSIITVVFMSH